MNCISNHHTITHCIFELLPVNISPSWNSCNRLTILWTVLNVKNAVHFPSLPPTLSRLSFLPSVCCIKNAEISPVRWNCFSFAKIFQPTYLNGSGSASYLFVSIWSTCRSFSINSSGRLVTIFPFSVHHYPQVVWPHWFCTFSLDQTSIWSDSILDIFSQLVCASYLVISVKILGSYGRWLKSKLTITCSNKFGYTKASQTEKQRY